MRSHTHRSHAESSLDFLSFSTALIEKSSRNKTESHRSGENVLGRVNEKVKYSVDDIDHEQGKLHITTALMSIISHVFGFKFVILDKVLENKSGLVPLRLLVNTEVLWEQLVNA